MEDGQAIEAREPECITKRSGLLNRASVRKFILEYCGRSPKYHVRKNMKRVSPGVYDDLEVKIREWIRNRVDSQPSKGMTVT